LVVNHGQELLGGLRVALFNGGQDTGDVAHGVGSHIAQVGWRRFYQPRSVITIACELRVERFGPIDVGGKPGSVTCIGPPT
ncbi:MAG TPA: hypothetical protein VGP68_00985, partial [Gemmataceae bacterium]|nr:hypothetical protein [Gemmataceae bacterium]